MSCGFHVPLGHNLSLAMFGANGSLRKTLRYIPSPFISALCPAFLLCLSDFEFLLNSIPADRLMLDIAYPKAISYHLCGSIICCNGSRGEFGTVSSLAAATLDLMQRKENQNKSSEGGNRHCKNTHPSRTAGVLRGTGSTQPTGGRECLCSIM